MSTSIIYIIWKKKTLPFPVPPPKKKAAKKPSTPAKLSCSHACLGSTAFPAIRCFKADPAAKQHNIPNTKGMILAAWATKGNKPCEFFCCYCCVCVFFFCFPIRMLFFDLNCFVRYVLIHISIILAWKQGSHPPSNDPCLHLVAPARPMASSNTCHQLVGRLHWGHPLQGSIQNHAAKTCSEKYGKTSKTTHPRMHHGHTTGFGAFQGSDWTYGNDTLGTSSCATTTTTDALKRKKIDDEPRPESGRLLSLGPRSTNKICSKNPTSYEADSALPIGPQFSTTLQCHDVTMSFVWEENFCTRNELTIHKEHVEAPLWGRPTARDPHGLEGGRLMSMVDRQNPPTPMEIVVYHLNSSTLNHPNYMKNIDHQTLEIYIHLKSSESSLVPRISLEMCTISLSTAAAMPWKSALQTSRPGSTAEPQCRKFHAKFPSTQTIHY